jgi:hypothetical protein
MCRITIPKKYMMSIFEFVSWVEHDGDRITYEVIPREEYIKRLKEVQALIESMSGVTDESIGG